MWSKFKEGFAGWICKRAGKEVKRVAPQWFCDLMDALDEPLYDLPRKMAPHIPIADKSLLQLIRDRVSELGSYGGFIVKCITAFQKAFNPKKGD